MKKKTRDILNNLKKFKGFNKEAISNISQVQWTQETINRLLDEDEMIRRGNPKMSLDEKYESAITSLKSYLTELEKDTREIETEVSALADILK